MTDSRAMRLNKDEYQLFKELKDEAEALAFVTERIANPIGKSYYTPADYRWATMQLRARLVEVHFRRWFSIWGLFNQKDKRKDNEHFVKQEELVISAMVESLDPLSDWVNSRYAVSRGSYLMPFQFASFKDEAEDWDLEDTLDEIKFGEHREHYSKIRYYWKKVKPANENPADERRHVILMDMETQKEAPLLPGVEPYQN